MYEMCYINKLGSERININTESVLCEAEALLAGLTAAKPLKACMWKAPNFVIYFRVIINMEQWAAKMHQAKKTKK